MTKPTHRRVARDPLVDFAASDLPFVEVWDVWSGILHEFRNHLKALTAAGLELRAELPPAIALHVSGAVHDLERNVQSLSALLSLADTSLRTGEPVVSPLDQVLDRAVRLAAPAVGPSVTISVTRGPSLRGAFAAAIGVKNRGKALECLLAALVTELARATPSAERAVTEPARAPHIELRAEPERGALAITVETDGGLPVSGSWRLMLAYQLAAKLDATVSPADDAAGFVVLLR